MKKSVIIPAILIATLMTGGIAVAKPYGKQFGGNGQPQMTAEQHAERVEAQLKRMDLLLDLSDAQEQQLAELINQRWEDRQQVRAERQDGRDERRAAMRNGDLDEAEIRALAAERAERRADRMVERAEMKKQVYAILTPQQQEKADALWNTRAGAGKGRGGNGFCL